MAALRNLVIGVLSRLRPVKVAAALRRHARDPRRPRATELHVLHESLTISPPPEEPVGIAST